MKEFPIKFLTLRDKNAPHRRSKSVPATKARPLSAEAFRAMFKLDNTKKHEAAKDVDESKIQEIQRRLDQLDITGVSSDHIRDIMATKFVDGDLARAATFIDIEQKAQAGIIVSYDPSVRLLGAENREGVTCYLDALLFAMFSKLDAFECMLNNEFPPENPTYRLVNLLRIWVNMLRSGNLIYSDLTKLIQEALADCGWSDARRPEQQDTSEAFAFLTETLQLPLLSLQVDLFHQGEKDDDDHKVVFERLLNLAVPPDPEGKGVKLEDCLEEYFNARVDVLRDSEVSRKSVPDDRTLEERTSLAHQSTIRPVSSDEASTTITNSTTTVTASDAAWNPTAPLDSSVTNGTMGASADLDSSFSSGVDESEEAGGSLRRPRSRKKSKSVIRRVLVNDQGRPAGEMPNAHTLERKGSSVVKAVTIPAWQFFRLIPWHTVANNEPENDREVALNFEQRPIVGICLKRYAMNQSGRPQRLNTFIDIPESLRLPHFMLAGGPEPDEEDGLSAEYKLELQSVVCHRGESLQSGHYIAFARVAPKLLTDNRRHDVDPPPDYEEAQWVRFDDLDLEHRVVFVDDIKQSLREEMPYLLFYRVVPMVDMTCPSTEGTEAEPPSYNETKMSIDLASSGSLYDSDVNGDGRRHRDDERLAVDAPVLSKPPSIRLSLEADRGSSEAEQPPLSNVEKPETASAAASAGGDSRRQSMVCIDSEAPTPAVTPDTTSPIITPSDESSTASRLTRAATRFALARQSRPASQSGEGRLNFSVTRLGGLRRGSKEPLAEPPTWLTPSAAASPGSEVPTPTPDSPLESPLQLRAGQLKLRGGKLREKSRPKNGGLQPERECSMM
ncbi:ubiquitin C-terminal hydrolase family protein [Ophiocordyceps camponoti-floridani]|uniref:ubiquitinyl hydrolase 1 n=1 Tax=Ophiocordyceps camponoti-floridani TaxID=2030778 RepID=A0A8H4QCH3_9HYPO|nr:ubiquitin C-terminal hydrolase family protein [Ophiocordyceps camponoti-floridani]